MDATSTPFLNELLASWIMMLVSFPLAGIVIWGIKDTSYTEEKTLYANELKPQVEVGGTDDDLLVAKEG